MDSHNTRIQVEASGIRALQPLPTRSWVDNSRRRLLGPYNVCKIRALWALSPKAPSV